MFLFVKPYVISEFREFRCENSNVRFSHYETQIGFWVSLCETQHEFPI